MLFGISIDAASTATNILSALNANEGIGRSKRKLNVLIWFEVYRHSSSSGAATNPAPIPSSQ